MQINIKGYMKAYMYFSDGKCMYFHPCVGITQGGVLRDVHSARFRVEEGSFPPTGTNIPEKPRGMLWMKGHVERSHRVNQGTRIKLTNPSDHRVRSYSSQEGKRDPQVASPSQSLKNNSKNSQFQ